MENPLKNNKALFDDKLLFFIIRLKIWRGFFVSYEFLFNNIKSNILFMQIASYNAY